MGLPPFPGGAARRKIEGSKKKSGFGGRRRRYCTHPPKHAGEGNENPFWGKVPWILLHAFFVFYRAALSILGTQRGGRRHAARKNKGMKKKTRHRDIVEKYGSVKNLIFLDIYSKGTFAGLHQGLQAGGVA